MKLTKLRSLAILCALAVLVFFGCKPPGGSDITITYLGWYYENIDLTFWDTAPGAQTAFYDFFVGYEGNIAFSDISSATVTAPGGGTWNVCPNSNFFDAQHKVIGGFGRFYDGSDPNVLPIGNFKAEVVLHDGTVARHTGRIPAPGSTTTGTYTSMHSQDGPSAADSAPMMLRATVSTATLHTTTKTVIIEFSVSDPLVYNGYVWFFDSSENYLGGFHYFRDPVTGVISPALGGNLFVNGTVNTLTLGSGDLTLAPGVSLADFFSNAAECVVVLTDGAQYGAGASHPRYDGQSISARTDLIIVQ
jgi:hypothetical protein